MNERTLKTLWHISLSALAVAEASTCNRKTMAGKLRFLMLTSCVGWHVGCSLLDWWDEEKGEK